MFEKLPDLPAVPNVDLSAGMDLLPFGDYSTGTKVLFVVFLVLAPLINFVGTIAQHDWLLTLIELIGLGYALPCFILHKYVDQYLYLKLVAKDVGTDAEAKGKASLIYGGILGAVIGSILILWVKFIPFGPEVIVAQMPLFTSTVLKVLYWILWSILWVLALPAAEIAFFFMFQATVWKDNVRNLLIASFYALTNWCWLFAIVGNFYWPLIFAALSFGLAYFFLIHRENKGAIELIGMRVGIAIGLLLVLIFLNFVYPSVKVPTLYLHADYRNVWSR